MDISGCLEVMEWMPTGLIHQARQLFICFFFSISREKKKSNVVLRLPQ
jgi:hypothetical protein